MPADLLDSHRKGKLILFCGAGISYQLHLKDFKGLTLDLYGKLNASEFLQEPEHEEYKEFEKENYDRVLGFLEDTNSELFRKELGEWGKIGSSKADYSTHKAIIDLSTTNGENKTRLVTTNFDLGFHNLVKDTGKTQDKSQNVQKYKKIRINNAPLLPVAKASQWNSIVHLHGTSSDPSTIVITSADFGSAYITERWASRFVTDLFYNFDILFIGYSLNDPVLRYLVDAISSDAKKKFAKTKRFALVKEGNKESWSKMNISPIEFNPADNFHYLHSTLKEWAKSHKKGLSSFKELCSLRSGSPPIEGDVYTERIMTELSYANKRTTGLFIYTKIEDGGKKVTKFPHQDWWVLISKREEEKNNTNEKFENLINILVIRNSEEFMPLKDIHELYIHWFVHLMQSGDIKKWVVGRGSCLHPYLVQRIYRHYNKIIPSLSEEDKKFWDYIIFYRDMLLGLDLRGYLSYIDLSPLTSQKIISLFKIYSELRHTLGPPDYELCFLGDDRHVYEYIRTCDDTHELETLFLHFRNEIRKIIDSEDHWQTNNRNFNARIPSISPHSKNEDAPEWVRIIKYLVACFDRLAKKKYIDCS